jgi:hypothetical protein
MSGLLRPVGPETSQTYWVRRALVFGATMVPAVAVVLIISGTSSGSAVRSNPSPPTVGFSLPASPSPSSTQPTMSTPLAVAPSASATSMSPTPAATKRKASTKKSDGRGPVDCPAEELRPTLTGKQRLAPKKPNTFELSLINGSAQTCMARVTKTNFELTIYSGGDRIWSTVDCPSVVKPISHKLRAEHAVAWTLTWDGKRSKPDCKSAREALRAGRYVATAQLEGAEPVKLRMILRQ